MRDGRMKIRLRNIDRRLLNKIRAYVDCINARSERKTASLTYKPMGR